MRVLIQYRYSPERHTAAANSLAAGELGPRLSRLPRGAELDYLYVPVQVPARVPRDDRPIAAGVGYGVSFSFEPEASTYVVRAVVADDATALAEVVSSAAADPDIVGVFADPTIEHTAVYCGQAAVGDVGAVIATSTIDALSKARLTGKGVDLAIVDTGINRAYLQSRGRHPRIASSLSYTPPGVASTPGAHPADHGTMCAFDAGIAAPDARLLDMAVLLSVGTFQGLLSDAISAYSRLLTMVRGRTRPKPLVVSNSWGLFKPATDFPVGHPGNYSDNPAHPFNIIVGSLDEAGADIVFAAGNCGRDCPDGRCRFASLPICGANSHPRVMSVAGVDTKRRRVGYSSQGPGRLSTRKPDIAAPTHFLGSEVFGAGEADSGTSAACPVAAGVIAAFRQKLGPAKLTPFELRNLISKTAIDLGGTGWDPDFGWGLVDASSLLARV